VAKTCVTTLSGDSQVIGYYSIAAGSVQKTHTPERIAKGLPNHPVPIVLLARLAVDVRFQGKGLGKGLLRDALARVCSAANLVGIRSLLVHAKDAQAAAFYTQYGFSASPIDPLHLMLLIKDIKRSLGC